MVRDNIHNEAHAVLLEGLGERFQVCLSAKLGIDGAVVRHIIAVGTPIPGPAERRSIQISDAEEVQVWYQRLGIRKAKAGGQLEPIRGDGHAAYGHLRLPLHMVSMVATATKEGKGARRHLVHVAPTQRPMAPLVEHAPRVQDKFPADLGPMGRQYEGDGLIMRI